MPFAKRNSLVKVRTYTLVHAQSWNDLERVHVCVFVCFIYFRMIEIRSYSAFPSLFYT